jgi:hypothetical protein
MSAWAAGTIQPLDMKPGLWEITLTVRSSGRPRPRSARGSRRKPKSAAEGPRTTVQKRCLDEQELRLPFALTFGGAGQGCRQSVVEASRNRQEILVDCAGGAAQGGGKFLIEAADPEHAKVSSSCAQNGRTQRRAASGARNSSRPGRRGLLRQAGQGAGWTERTPGAPGPINANAFRNRAVARRRSGDEKGAAEDSRKAADLENRR